MLPSIGSECSRSHLENSINSSSKLDYRLDKEGRRPRDLWGPGSTVNQLDLIQFIQILFRDMHHNSTAALIYQYILLFSSYCGHFVYITNIFCCLPRAFKETIRISFHYVLCVFLIVRSQYLVTLCLTLYAAVLANSGLFYYKIDIESQWEYSWLNKIN